MSNSDLPQGWSWIPLGELIQPIMTRDPSQESNIEITYFDISSIDNELGVVTNPKRVLSSQAPSRARQVVEAGDVLFSTVRPYLRGIAQVPITENGVASTGFCVLRPAGSISAKYLYFWVRGNDFLDGLLPLQRGASYPAVRKEDVLAQLVPVAPIAEQTRIVEKLEELLTDLDAGVAELEAAQKKLVQYRQSLLKAAVDGTLTAEWRAERAQRGEATESGAQLLARILTERRAHWEAKQLAEFNEEKKAPPKGWQDKYTEPVQPNISDLPTLPDGWIWASADCLILEIETGKSFKCVERTPTIKEIGVVKVSAVSWGEYNELESKTCINDDRVNEELFIKPGDLLFSRANTFELVGACVIAERVNLNVMLSDKILRFKLVSKETKDWLLFLLKSQIGRKQIEALASGNQESMKNIGQERIRNIAVPIAPIIEIRHTVKMVNRLFAGIRTQLLA